MMEGESLESVLLICLGGMCDVTIKMSRFIGYLSEQASECLLAGDLALTHRPPPPFIVGGDGVRHGQGRHRRY